MNKRRFNDVLVASQVSIGLCDYCPAVHINLLDVNGNVLATAAVALTVAPAFIADFQAKTNEAATRVPAGTKSQ